MSDHESYVEPDGHRNGETVPTTSAAVAGSDEAERQVASQQYGMHYAPENRLVVERARAVPDEQWNELPIEDLPLGTPLEADEETLSWKIIDKVVSNVEAIRPGYVTKLWRTDDGRLHIVDGHHRVAMYYALRSEMPVRIMDSTFLDRLAKRPE